MRRPRAILTLIWDISLQPGGDIAFSTAKKGRYIVTYNPSEGQWYQFFAIECAARMDDVIYQGRSYSIQIVLNLVDMYER